MSTQGDIGADRNLYGWFCPIFATVRAPDNVEVWLTKEVPTSEAVEQWIRQTGADYTAAGLKISLSPKDVDKLRDLSAAFRSIVRRGAR